jgi:hypothetical protein
MMTLAQKLPFSKVEQSSPQLMGDFKGHQIDSLG